jgi:hypothetical protein
MAQAGYNSVQGTCVATLERDNGRALANSTLLHWNSQVTLYKAVNRKKMFFVQLFLGDGENVSNVPMPMHSWCMETRDATDIKHYTVKKG